MQLRGSLMAAPGGQLADALPAGPLDQQQSRGCDHLSALSYKHNIIIKSWHPAGRLLAACCLPSSLWPAFFFVSPSPRPNGLRGHLETRHWPNSLAWRAGGLGAERPANVTARIKLSLSISYHFLTVSLRLIILCTHIGVMPYMFT